MINKTVFFYKPDEDSAMNYYVTPSLFSSASLGSNKPYIGFPDVFQSNISSSVSTVPQVQLDVNSAGAVLQSLDLLDYSPATHKAPCYAPSYGSDATGEWQITMTLSSALHRHSLPPTPQNADNYTCNTNGRYNMLQEVRHFSPKSLYMNELPLAIPQYFDASKAPTSANSSIVNIDYLPPNRHTFLVPISSQFSYESLFVPSTPFSTSVAPGEQKGRSSVGVANVLTPGVSTRAAVSNSWGHSAPLVPELKLKSGSSFHVGYYVPPTVNTGDMYGYVLDTLRNAILNGVH